MTESDCVVVAQVLIEVGNVWSDCRKGRHDRNRTLVSDDQGWKAVRNRTELGHRDARMMGDMEANPFT